MRCEKNSFIVCDSKKEGFSSTYWSGDKWKCPICGQEIVCGFGTGTQEIAAGVEALEFVYNV